MPESKLGRCGGQGRARLVRRTLCYAMLFCAMPCLVRRVLGRLLETAEVEPA